MADVKLSVRHELGKIIEELEKIRDKNTEVHDSFKELGKGVEESLNTEVKKTETFFNNLSSLGRRVANQLLGDFKTLLSINALQEALKITNQFKNSISESVALSDTIRKLGSSFGVAGKDFVRFQSMMTKGLGEIGLSSESAANAMKGLAGFGVTGEQNVLSYSKTAGQLAGIGGEKGREGAISGALAGVVRSRGGDVNDVKMMEEVAKEVTKAMQATGKGASELLQNMDQVFSTMPDDLRRAVGPKGLGQIAVAGTVAGPGATEALKRFLGMGKEERAALEAQGFGKIFKGGKIDLSGLSDVAKELKQRGTSPRLAAQTLGFQGTEAEGLVRLIENADKVAEAFKRTEEASGDYNKRFRETMGLSEAFNATLNRVKASTADFLSPITQGITDLLSRASETTEGSAAVALGGAGLAAILAGAGTRGIGKGLLGGIAGTAAKGMAAEAITGQKTVPVYVTNANEIGQQVGLSSIPTTGGIAGAGGTAGKILGTAGAAIGAGAVGYEIGSAINEIPGVSDAIVKGFEKVAGIFGKGPVSNEEAMRRGAGMVKPIDIRVKVHDEKNRELKSAKQPNRGAAF